MNKLKRIIIISGLMLTVICMMPSAFAQGPGFDEDVEDVPVPFDAGVSLIAAAAAGYGIKKLRDRKK